MLEHANDSVRQTADDEPGFQFVNRGYNSVFRPNRLSLGLVVPCGAEPALQSSRNRDDAAQARR